MEDFKKRMLVEYQELQDRMAKLEKALKTGGFKEKVGKFQYNMMIMQYHGMATYLCALGLRMDNLNMVKDDTDNKEC